MLDYLFVQYIIFVYQIYPLLMYQDKNQNQCDMQAQYASLEVMFIEKINDLEKHQKYKNQLAQSSIKTSCQKSKINFLIKNECLICKWMLINFQKNPSGSQVTINKLKGLTKKFQNIHPFHYFNFLIQLYSQQNGSYKKNSQLSQKKICDKRENISKTNRFIIKNLKSNEILLSNPEYICCTTHFNKNQKILQRMEHRNFILTTQDKLLQESEMEKMICALLNSKLGGYILVGVSDSFQVEGILIESKEKKIINATFQESLKHLYPKNDKSIYLDYIIVENALLSDQDYEERKLYVVRIKVHPVTVKQFYYIRWQQGYRFYNSFYVLGNDFSYQAIHGEYIYELMLKKMAKEEKEVHLHDFKLCTKPRSKQIDSHQQSQVGSV